MKKYFLLIGFLALTVACNIGATPPEIESTPTTAPLSTPSPVPSTPTFIPAPAATQTPPPQFFTEEFETPSTYWEFIQTGGIDLPSASFENSALRINIPSPNTWYIGIYNAHTYSNILVTTKTSATPTGSIGLICRYDETKGWFEFNVASDGTYSALFGQWLAPGIAEYSPIASDLTKQLEAGNLNYEIGLSCQDDSLLLLVNGTLIRRLDVSRFELSEGAVGITASSFKETPMTASFEWLKVEP